MDGCSLSTLNQLIPTAEQVKTALSVVGSIVIAASVLTSITPTPAAGTRLAHIYRYLELAALLFGRAKQAGVLPATIAADRALAKAIALARGEKLPP
jgi:hypothetical protein